MNACMKFLAPKLSHKSYVRDWTYLIIGFRDFDAAESRKCIFMSEKDYNVLMELAEELLKEKVTREEALQTFIRAGILDENGNYTKPYECLNITSIS